jgi:hypothetical protein
MARHMETGVVLGDRYVELPAQRRDSLWLDFGLVPWKPTAIGLQSAHLGIRYLNALNCPFLDYNSCRD